MSSAQENQTGPRSQQSREADKHHRRQEKRYTCDECGKAFVAMVFLKTHQVVHSGDRKYKCTVCGKGFFHPGNLRRHQSSHGRIKPYKCDKCKKLLNWKDLLAYPGIISGEARCIKCEKSFPLKCDLISRPVVKTVVAKVESGLKSGVKSCICDQCGKRYTQKQDLEVHKLIHRGVSSYKCDQCGKIFIQRRTLWKHLVTLCGVKAHTCKVCGKSFIWMGTRNAHQRIHTRRDYRCAKCGKWFATKRALKSHKVSHSKKRRHKCGLCNKAFQHLKSLRAHRRIHTRKGLTKCSFCEKQSNTAGCSSQLCRHCGGAYKAFCCGLCGKIFSHQIILKVHQRRHTGHKPKYCKKCGKGFPTVGALKRHESLHSRVAPPCGQCGATFTTAFHRKMHKQIHPEPKPYKCRYCNKRFSKMHKRFYHECRHIKEDRSAFSDNQKSHFANELFPCLRCARMFISLSALFKHYCDQKRAKSVNWILSQLDLFK